MKHWKRCLALPSILPFLSLAKAKNAQETIVQQPPDTIEYKVFVAVDKAGVKHWGGKEAYQAKLRTFFGQMNDFWN